MASGPQADNRVCVAQIGAAHGVRGEVRLRAFTDDPMAIARYGPLQAEDGRPIAITALRPANGFMVAQLAGIDDRNAAERLTNIRLYVPRERLPALTDADDFYHADLIGLAVVDRDGHEMGSVAAVHNFGAGDLIEMKPARGPAVMVPFTKAAVPQVDLKARRLIVDPVAAMIPHASELDGAPHPTLEGEGRRRRRRGGVNVPGTEPAERSPPPPDRLRRSTSPLQGEVKRRSRRGFGKGEPDSPKRER